VSPLPSGIVPVTLICAALGLVCVIKAFVLDSVGGERGKRPGGICVRSAHVAIAIEISCPEAIHEKTNLLSLKQSGDDGETVLVSACHHVCIEAPSDCWYVFSFCYR